MSTRYPNLPETWSPRTIKAFATRMAQAEGHQPTEVWRKTQLMSDGETGILWYSYARPLADSTQAMLVHIGYRGGRLDRDIVSWKVEHHALNWQPFASR